MSGPLPPRRCPTLSRAWGINSFGQLGDDSFAPRSKQVAVKGAGGVGSFGDVTSLDGGQNHTVALKNGTAYAWGHNGSGQLDTGPTSGTGADIDLPVKVHGAGDVGFLTDVVTIKAGSSHSLAVKGDGTVWTWGYDGFGQLGDNASHAGSQSRLPVQVEGVGGSGFLTGVSSVAGGDLHSLALKSDGSVYAWGLNNFGQIGDDSTVFHRNAPVKVKSEGGADSLTDAADVAAGAHHSVAVASTHDTVWSWGHNEFGTLGTGSFGGNFDTPVESIQLIGATRVATGDFHSLAVAEADISPPDTGIDPGSLPPASSGDNSASFEFSSSATDLAGFQCKLDAEAFASCLSPKSYSGLSEGSHTFLVRARGVAGNVDTSPASHTWTVDTVDPSGTVEINGGDDLTNDAAVNLTLSADDPSPGTGVAEMSFSNDGATWSIPEPFATSKSWNLSGGDGEKTVHVRYRDAAGNETTAQDTVELDTTAPSVETWNPKGKKVSPRAKPSVTFSEEMDEATVEASTSGKPTTFMLKKKAPR